MDQGSNSSIRLYVFLSCVYSIKESLKLPSILSSLRSLLSLEELLLTKGRIPFCVLPTMTLRKILPALEELLLASDRIPSLVSLPLILWKMLPCQHKMQLTKHYSELIEALNQQEIKRVRGLDSSLKKSATLSTSAHHWFISNICAPHTLLIKIHSGRHKCFLVQIF